MKINVSNEAIKWFEDEMGTVQGNAVRLYVKYGGSSSIQDGFSLGVMFDEPDEMGAKSIYNGLTLYVEKEDLWYFNGHNLKLDVNKENDELEFSYYK